MNLIKFDPYARTASLDNMFDALFNGTVGDYKGVDNLLNRPAVNISETDAAFALEVAAPGLSKGDFDISVEKNTLTISAERNAENGEEQGRYTRREFSYGTFRRTFRLPKTIEQDAINATYDNGVLKVMLPKKADVVKQAQAREIKVS